MLLGGGAERIHHLIDLGDCQPIALAAVLSRIKRFGQTLLPEKVFVYEIDEILADVLVPAFPASTLEVRVAGLGRGVMFSALPSTRTARVLQT